MNSGRAKFWLRMSGVLWLILFAFSLFAQENKTEKAKPPFPSVRLSHRVRNEEAIRALGDRLPEVAAWYGKTTNELAKLLRHDHTLWVTESGRLMYECALEAPLSGGAADATGSVRAQAASLPLDQTFKLHSLPGSQKTVYLDFNGQTVSGTVWNASYNGGRDIVAAPFDLDGDPTTFNATELQMIQNIWKRVAEDYSPFDVDVTTEEPSLDALRRISASDTQYGNRVIITPTQLVSGYGGYSYIGVFDDTSEYYKTSWVFSTALLNGEKYIAEACSHENGHSLGLHHEGTTSGTTYYEGQGDWAPIMGNSYYRNVTQWAKGEYVGANNTEDQLQVMLSNGLAYYPDDHGNTADTATTLTGVTSLSGSGFIERNTDVDAFKFLTGNGTIEFAVNPAPLGPDLNILAELRDNNWNVLSSSNLTNLGASITASVSAGTYYLTVHGTGSGDPATTGYSNYASLGQYVISGAVVDPGSLKPPSAIISVNSGSSGEAPLSVSLSGSGSTDDGAIVSYTWNFGDGSPTQTGVSVGHTYSYPGSYKVTLTATDNDGLTGSASITISVTKTIYVSAISLVSNSSSKSVSASGTVILSDLAGNPVSGATVTAAWSGIVQGSSSGTTNSSGAVTFASPSSSNSGTITLTITGVSAPGYTFDPQAGQKSASTSVNLIPTTPDTTPPTVAIVSPQSGATVSGVVSVKVQAADNSGVKKVELYVDGKLAATSTLAPFTIKWNTNKVSRGQHTIQSKAYDTAGNCGISAPVSLSKQ